MTATTTGLTEEARNPTIGANRACPNKEGRKDKYSSNKESGEANGTTTKGSLCDGCEQRNELLQLWKIWTLGKEL